MIIDVATGEPYGAIIYADLQTVVLWTDGRESQIATDRLTDPVELGGFAVIARFQTVGDVVLDPAAADRRAQLADYAARNGGQIIEHREAPPQEAPAPGLGGRLAALFAPRA